MKIKRDSIVNLIDQLKGTSDVLSCKNIESNLYITRSGNGALGIFLDGVSDNPDWPNLQKMMFYPKQRYSISTLPSGEKRMLTDCIRVEVDSVIDLRAVASIIEMMMEDSVHPYNGSDLQSAIERYRDLLKSSRPKLTEEELKGLWGELLFLRELIFRCKSRDSEEQCLDSWKSSANAKRDFRMPKSGIVFEIKTTEKDSRTHEISSADQLTTKAEEKAGYLVSIGVKREEGGVAMTISSIYQSIQSRLDSELSSKLTNLLLERGWSDDGSQDISLIRSVGIPLRLFDFESVPSLLPLPDGVPNASWIVQLNDENAISRKDQELVIETSIL